MGGLELAVLGHVAVRRDGIEVDLGAPRQRAVLAAVALGGGAGREVSLDTVVERVWGGSAPDAAASTVHGHVARLRRALEPDRPPRTPPRVLVTVGDGYRLDLEPEAVDEHRFETALTQGRELLTVVRDPWRPAVAPGDRERVEAALDALDGAVELWRGTPYADLRSDPAAEVQRARLTGLLTQAEELRAVGQLALGRHEVLLADLEKHTAEEPLHERWWGLRAVALSRASRQAEALAVLTELRGHLADELGVDPSPPLRELYAAILAQHPSVTDATGRAADRAPAAALSGAGSGWPWAMVGRGAELGALREALDAARAGRPAYAVLTGEAGVGKTRLTEELAAHAAELGVEVVTGRCSRDDGAPPLWPWLSVLSALGQPPPPQVAEEAGGLFRVRADTAAAVLAAAEEPLLLVLEDLHWADPSTLGVLRLLAEQPHTRPLAVVVTWRTRAGASADLGPVAEVLSRRHAVRLDLDGLDEAGAGRVFAEVAGVEPDAAARAALHRRTAGNPFFVVELARYAAERLDGDGLTSLLESAAPTAVLDVVDQRLADLDDATTTVLRSAAVIGRTFDLDTLAGLTRIGAEALLDLVEPAVRAGLVHEDAAEVFRFEHALVRDALYASMTVTRLARTHAVVARQLAVRGGREAEVATHWLAAGPAHVATAWRALADAARAAGRASAYVEAAGLLEQALARQAEDAGSDPRDRVGLLEQAIAAYRWAAMLPELIGAVEQLLAVAEALGDEELHAWAATQVGQTMLWRSAGHGEVHDGVVGALRRGLERLPADRVALRARILATLAMELREIAPLRERIALCEQAAALARPLDEPELLCDVLLLTAMTTWSPSTVHTRLALSDEVVALAPRHGYEHALVMGLTVRAVVLGELGRPTDLATAIAEARVEAERLQVVYSLLVLDELEMVWLAAAGRDAELDALWAETEERLSLMASTGSGGELAIDRHFDLCAVRTWQGRPLEGLPNLHARLEAGYPVDPLVAVTLWRGGEREAATASVTGERLHEVLEMELGFSLVLWCLTAETALHLDLPDVAARARELMAPYAGLGSGADGLYYGPVDAFLALAAQATGDSAAATAHADDAARLLEEWDQPPVQRWLAQTRAICGF